MKVSVLIAAYQAGPYILTALQSVRAQTHTDWEVIVVEDGSHDQTEMVVSTFAATCTQTVSYRNLGSNHGVGTARNRLLELASGDVVAFIDADDYWEPQHLAAAVAKIAAGADLAVSGIRTFDLKTGATLKQVPVPPSLLRDPIQALFELSEIITSSAVVLTRALAVRTGQFDTTLRIGEDRDYWLRCALEGGRFSGTDQFTCNYAKHDASSMARTLVVAEHELRFYEKYRSLAEIPRKVRQHHRAASLISLGRLLRQRDPQRSAACFWKAWRCEPFNPRIPVQLAFTGWRSVLAAGAS
jgi:glycosyltransferase involved in cell wall biosynthesis